MENPNHYTCPVCGFDRLEYKPYKNMPPITPEIYKLAPPYSDHWGMGSYDVCSCCGFEYGNDDEGMNPETNSSFASYLLEWIKDESAEWFEPDQKPEGWTLVAQLEKAGVPVPPEANGVK